VIGWEDVHCKPDWIFTSGKEKNISPYFRLFVFVSGKTLKSLASLCCYKTHIIRSISID